MKSNKKQHRGFTLVELMIVLVILGVISVGTITAITGQSKVYHSEEDLIDAQMNARIAADRISFLLRMAGTGCSDSFGKKLDTGNLATNGNPAANPTTSMFVVTNKSPDPSDSDYGSDQLTLVGAVRYVGSIDPTGGIPAAGQIKLQCNEPPKIDGTATKKYIFITPQDENRYRTISGISGTTLTLSNNLGTDEKNELQDALTAGIVLDVCQVQAFTIRLVNNSLRIDDNISGSSTQFDVADNIQDLQFQYGIDTSTPPDGQINSWVDNPTDIAQILAVRFFILARTSKADIGGRGYKYIDKKTYTLAGVTVGPFTGTNFNDLDNHESVHRYLLESTIAIRSRNF